MIAFDLRGIRAIPKQSFRISGKGGYTPARVKKYEGAVKLMMRSQMDAPMALVQTPIESRVIIQYSTKDKKKWGEPKITRPDVQDNLLKPLFDAMNGLVYDDDSRVWKVEAMKVYGPEDRIMIELDW